MSRTQPSARTLALACLLFLLLASGARSQATIKSLARQLEPLEETTDVRLTRFADFTDEPVVRAGMALEPGDLVASGTGDVDLELECPNGSLLRFSGNYRVLIDVPGDGVDCAVDFLSGTVDVLADKPTEIQAGGVVLGSEGTQYTVELNRSQGPDVSCQVYDGRVAWRLRRPEPQWLTAGDSIRVVEQKVDVAKISPQQISSTAFRYARFDVANARAAGFKIADEKLATQDLAQAHEKVLAQPRDTELRVDLAKAQLRYSLSPQAVYNLHAVGVQSEEQMKRYEIDVDRLRAPAAGTFRIPTSGSRSLTALGAATPWTLVQQKRYKEALELGMNKVEAGSATSRDYYALALAYRELEGQRSRQAAGYAARSLKLQEQDGELTPDELKDCKRLAQGY